MFTALPLSFPLAKFAINCTDPPQDIISHCEKDNCQHSTQRPHLLLLLTKLHKIAAVDMCMCRNTEGGGSTFVELHNFCIFQMHMEITKKSIVVTELIFLFIH